MKKICGFFKKHKKGLIALTVVVVVIGAVAISFDLRVKNQWKKHPVEEYHFDFVDNGDMETMRKRILSTKYDDKLNVDDILKDLNEDGSFKSIDYKSEAKNDWQPLNHLKKVMDLQVAYYSKGNPHFNDPQVKTAVTKAMTNWVKNDYKCEWNWWYNVVGVGKYVPDILLFGVSDLSKEAEAKLLENIKSTLLQNEQVYNGAPSREVDSSGGNLTDQVLSTMKVAIVENDGNTMMWLTNLLDRELHPFPDYEPHLINQIFRADCVGIKTDGSFQQHDQLIYFGGYGEVFADGMNKYIEYTKGTQYALDNEALNLYADFLLDGMQYVTRGGYRDISASGRGISRADSLTGISSQVKSAAEILLRCNGIKRADELKTMLDTRFLSKKDAGATGHKYFYESDFQVMNNKNYMATVRAASPKTRIYEFLNGENPLAYYTGMGATFFYVNGNEYYNVLPLYDWNKIPGTTTKQGFVPYYDEGFSYNTYGENNTVSGVSNGKIGMNIFAVDDHDVTGNKAYFMFEDGVVCLGNNLKGENLLTNINQANLVGNVILGDKNDIKMELGDKKSGKYSYVYHNQISYITDAEVDVASEHIKGDWKTLNERLTESKKIEGDRFTISIPHKENNASYAYTVLLNTNLKKTKDYVDNARYKVLQNDETCQAVLDNKTGVVQVAFLKKGELKIDDSTTVSANKPCLLIIDGEKITAASYNGKEADVKINLNGKEVAQTINKKSKTF